ncbi:MAG TPA: DUF4258 domain-containing protein [Ktedonobacterales bacterium]|nr:DUF4258 domain-containing protein [Ktedonobacterales bacterium]
MRNDPSRSRAVASLRATSHASVARGGRGGRVSLADAQSLCAPIRQSYHGRRRAAQRNLGVTDVEYIMLWGHIIHRTGAVFYCLRAKDIPAQHRHLPQITRLMGSVVLTSHDEEIITLYRNPGALRDIQRKMKYRFTPGPNLICADLDEGECDEDDTAGDAGSVEPLRATA